MAGPERRLPAPMQAGLQALARAVQALPPHQPGPRMAPSFGPGPTTAQLAALPPALAAASVELGRVLAAPAQPATWPVANTPAIQAMLDAKAAAARARCGRPTTVQPNQVVRLVRYVGQGMAVPAAAAKSGLKRTTAQRVLSGQCEIAHHPAVTAAGVFLPPLKAAQNPPKTRQRPERPALATTPATSVAGAPVAPHSQPQGEPA